MPFSAIDEEGILTLRLDTPGAPINIFNHATAEQLIGLLADVRPSTTRAVVFTSAKPYSFINGVGLLLAHASRTTDDVVRAGELPWRAYLAVHELPVPTIAWVQGNCYGCGVEFILNCDHRVAVDACGTEFYMTEVNEYLFHPLFGSTWNLPATVGIEHAIDLLLWGERWDARTASQRGLIDAVVTEPDETTRRAWVEKLLAGGESGRVRQHRLPAKHDELAIARARDRIDRLPSNYRPLYREALELLRRGAKQQGAYAEHQRLELECSARSALSPEGKAAYSFFYIRQMAAERASGRDQGTLSPVSIYVDADERQDPEIAGFVADLERRRLSSLTITKAPPSDFLLYPSGRADPSCRADLGVPIALHSSIQSRVEPTALSLRRLAKLEGCRLIEVAVPTHSPAHLHNSGKRLSRVLQRVGFEVARTSIGSTFVSDALLAAFLRPLVRFVQAGGAGISLDKTLREAGFVRPISALIEAVGSRHLAGMVCDSANREVEAALRAIAHPALPADGATDENAFYLLDALALSLLEAVLRALEDSGGRDVSTIDLIARELLDFPRHWCSLCRWLTHDRIAAALTGDERTSNLVDPAALSVARAFVAEGRAFYR